MPHRFAAGVCAGVGVVVVALGLATGSTAAATPVAPRADGTVNRTSADVAAAALGSARDLADAPGGATVVTPDVVDDLGYTPVIEGTLASKATGDCSSPVPLPSEFEPACRSHDLGYDLLRVAHRHGSSIPSGLRSDLDSQLGRQMRQSCGGDLMCEVMASIALVAVRFNTARQGYGAPVEESLPW